MLHNLCAYDNDTSRSLKSNKVLKKSTEKVTKIK
jgi:hypothetical protein